MDLSSKPQMFFDEVSPLESGAFLEFADRMNIPLNQVYLDQLQNHVDRRSFDLNPFELAVRDSKVKSPEDEILNDRRLQNALWRAWWRQKQIRLYSLKQLSREDEKFEQLEAPPAILYSLLQGKEIDDIPTVYNIPTLQAHELPVIGTYVDPDISPGFSYRVRVNGTNEVLFGGKALLLERVGAGYGKRLTFESDDILNNDNFFWSDSNPDGGFAFSIQVLSGGETFKVFDSTGSEVGQAEVTRVENQKIVRSKVYDDNLIKNVHAHMDLKITFSCDRNLPDNLQRNTTVFSVLGTVISQKIKGCQRAVVKEVNIKLPDIGYCVLK